MKIDEEKQYGLYKLEKNTAINENKKIFSDHNSKLTNLDFKTPTKEQRPKKIITKKGYERYRTIIEEQNVSKLLKSGDLQERYNKWFAAIETSIKTVQRTKTKNPRKDIKGLQKICKRLREEYSITVELHEKILIENENIEITSHPATRRRGDVVTTSLCTAQQRRKYVSNETPNDVSVERRQDVSVVRLHDVLLVCRDHVSRGRNDDVSSVRLHDVSNKSQMKHPTTSQWYVTKTSQWYVSTTSH